MLKIEETIKVFDVVKKTDRDAEIPVLLEFLQKIAPIKSILDCGSHSSVYNEYANKIRPLAKRYDGIDIIPDLEAAQILDNFYVGNAINYPLNKYEMIICMSTLEHAGESTYKVDYPYMERERLFRRCLDLSEKYLWISFPVGQTYTYPNELSIIDKHELTKYEGLISGFKVKERFLYSQGPQAGHPWYEHEKRDVALKIPYIDYVGNCSICVLEIEKE